MRLIICKLLIISVLFASCANDTPMPDLSDIPVFSINGVFDNGDTLAITAGVEDYYLFTSYEKGADNIHVFSGEFRDVNCENECTETLKISIRDNEATDNADINTALVVGQNYDFVGENTTTNTDTTYLLSLSGSFDNPFGTLETYIWTIANNEYFEQNIELELNNLTALEVQLFAKDSTVECNSEIRKVLFNSGLGVGCAVDFEIVGTPNSTTYLEAAISNLNNPPYTYSWSDGSNADNILLNTAGDYCLTVTDNLGCESSICKTINYLQNMPMACSADFSYNIEEQYEMEEDSLNLSKISIEYVDADGKIWRSDRANQANNSTFFTIDNVEEHDQNENEEATKKIDIRFSVTLFDEDLNELQLTDAEGVIAVAYGL